MESRNFEEIGGDFFFVGKRFLIRADSMTMIIQKLRNEMADTITRLQCLNPGQLHRLYFFCNPNFVDLDLGLLAKRIHQYSETDFHYLVNISENRFTELDPPNNSGYHHNRMVERNGIGNFGGTGNGGGTGYEYSGFVNNGSGRDNLGQQTYDGTNETVEIEFVQLYHLMILRRLFLELSNGQLSKLLEVIGMAEDVMFQFQLLQNCQQVLEEISSNTLSNIHCEIQQISRIKPGSETNHLNNILRLPQSHFYFYTPLLSLLQLPLNELLNLQKQLPYWDTLHFTLLIRLHLVGYIEFSDLINVLIGPEKNLRYSPKQSLKAMLEIVEQPAAKLVYKRGLNPVPAVGINLSEFESNLNNFQNPYQTQFQNQLQHQYKTENSSIYYLVPLLIRADTGDIIKNGLSGDEQIRVSVTDRVVYFKNLRILTTYHLNGECLFKLKFELRKMTGNQNGKPSYEVLATVISKPMYVVSHSNILEVKQNLPQITEVIPFSGPTTGLMRVVILGNNFIESPTARVKFDNIEVIPFYHGPKTLICNAPPHVQGNVSVTVCNNPDGWSTSAANFSYYNSIEKKNMCFDANKIMKVEPTVLHTPSPTTSSTSSPSSPEGTLFSTGYPTKVEFNDTFDLPPSSSNHSMEPFFGSFGGDYEDFSQFL